MNLNGGPDSMTADEQATVALMIEVQIARADKEGIGDFA